MLWTGIFQAQSYCGLMKWGIGPYSIQIHVKIRILMAFSNFDGPSDIFDGPKNPWYPPEIKINTQLE